MSLKISNPSGFKIGGVLNPSITVIYVRVLADMTKEFPIETEGAVTDVEIKCQAKTTITGGRFDDAIKVDYIFKDYFLKYSVSVSDMNTQYVEIENDLKNKLILDNPEWEDKIEIITVGVGPVE